MTADQAMKLWQQAKALQDTVLVECSLYAELSSDTSFPLELRDTWTKMFYRYTYLACDVAIRLRRREAAYTQALIADVAEGMQYIDSDTLDQWEREAYAAAH